MLLETPDSTRLAVDVWGTGRPVVLVHAWGLSSHMWNAQLPAFVDAGLQVITLDQRGHGRSERPAGGYDLDTMAADLITVLDELDVRDAAVVGQSMGGTVVAHAVGGIGSERVTDVVLSAPITPCLTVGDDNQLGLPAEAFAANRAALVADIGAWLTANSVGYWGVGDDRFPHDTAWTLRSIYETPLPVLLATNAAVHDSGEAVRMAESANRLAKGTNPAVLDVLAMAYASDGRMDIAARTAQLALQRALASRNDKLAAEIRDRLTHYQEAAAQASPGSVDAP